MPDAKPRLEISFGERRVEIWAPGARLPWMIHHLSFGVSPAWPLWFLSGWGRERAGHTSRGADRLGSCPSSSQVRVRPTPLVLQLPPILLYKHLPLSSIIHTSSSLVFTSRTDPHPPTFWSAGAVWTGVCADCAVAGTRIAIAMLLMSAPPPPWRGGATMIIIMVIIINRQHHHYHHHSPPPHHHHRCRRRRRRRRRSIGVSCPSSSPPPDLLTGRSRICWGVQWLPLIPITAPPPPGVPTPRSPRH
jgi:hypothetical protein